MVRLWSIAKVRIGKVSNVYRDVRVGRRRWFTSRVMSFGDGSHGALGMSGMGMGMDAYEPTLISNLPSDVSFISAGHYHSLAVTSGGEIWAWGRNEEGQLGRIASRSSRSEPKRVEGLENVSVRAGFASGVISTAIGDDGSLWVWGRSKRGQLGLGKGIIEALVPSRVETLAEEHIVKVSLGWGHALALTVDGKVFGWGYVADGRVGNVGLPLEPSLLDSLTNGYDDHQNHEDAAEKKVEEAMKKENNMPIAWEPRLVEELRDVKVADIACGSDHSLVLCHDGTLLSSGSNIYGQLGRQSKQELGMSPVGITGSPISVAAGLGHSLAICNIQSDSNTRRIVSSWGWNRSQQLGRGKPENVPREVEGLDGETPASLSAGRVHSLCVTEKGEAWVWGCGKNGRLGLGSSIDEPEPMLLEDVEGCVLQAVAGFDHSFILVTNLDV
ncbi:hypothetical protein EUTSA_v10020741mg [Eutrema salsugineum]|uniref:RCC1-like domain-containing protein n=1 Tax=Eutrema salsugineum TaxID=72664 RepID=V4NQU2_EUTSA|nr:ultraviolet-B receptor UVR8 [Eutrema salsugineum]ESQ48976.1 hypothetical protein EUTSA_v10020741mg [Eutrema salsugineum]